MHCFSRKHRLAGVVELADAPDSKSGARKGVGVRPSPPAPIISKSYNPACLSSCTAFCSIVTILSLLTLPILSTASLRNCVPFSAAPFKSAPFVILWQSNIERVLCFETLMDTVSGTPARLMVHTAILLRSWKSLPSFPPFAGCLP